MITLPIILISLFTTPITANDSYCDQQYLLLQITTNNEQSCSTDNTPIRSCNPNNKHQPPICRMQCWREGKWTTTSVFGDTEMSPGGWTVIQRRINGSVDFNRPWSDYEKGFGDPNGEFWYGLKSMNCLTKIGQWELRIDFEFKNGTRSYLHYNEFKVGSATDEYPLTIGGFTGITPTDPFVTHPHNGRKFSTYDNDNDQWSRGNCAIQADGTKDNGGWWHDSCWNINLNIQYNPAQYGSMLLAGTWYNPRWIEMKIRPLNCTLQ